MPFLQTTGGGSISGFNGRSERPLIEYTDTYNYTGASQSFAIPNGCKEVTAYVFGPGGGAEGNNNTKGGAGGYTVGTIDVSAGGTLRIIVGGAGGPGEQSNGSGGGYSGVFTSAWQGSNVNTDHNAAILVAGGGGGSGDASTDADGAGAGGYPNGQQGNPSGSGGNGGTQSAGGSYPGNPSGGSCTANSSGGCVGGKLRGGVGCGGAEQSAGVGWPNQIYGGTWGSAAGGNGCNAGAGGAGYYGGGGGGGQPNGGNGGGGSGYIGGHTNYPVSNANGYSGSYDIPPSAATNSQYWSTGISMGGIYNVNNGGNGNHTGGHGRIVLNYFAP